MHFPVNSFTGSSTPKRYTSISSPQSITPFMFFINKELLFLLYGYMVFPIFWLLGKPNTGKKVLGVGLLHPNLKLLIPYMILLYSLFYMLYYKNGINAYILRSITQTYYTYCTYLTNLVSDSSI